MHFAVRLLVAAFLSALTTVSAGDAFSLSGTALFPGGGFAVFDGNRGAYRTSVHAGEQIAGCTLVEIGFDRVRLRSGDREFELTMNEQARREDGGPWTVIVSSERFTARETAAPESGAASPPAGGMIVVPGREPMTGGGLSEAAAKEMVRTEKEIGKVEKKFMEAVKREGKEAMKLEDAAAMKIYKQAGKEMRRGDGGK